MSTDKIVRFNNRSVTSAQAGRFIERLTNNNARPVFLATFVLLCSVTGAFAQDNAADPQLKIDIPTKLDKSNVVIDFGHAVFNGDTPFALGDINLLANDLGAWNAKGAIVVIFHGDAAYFVLNDQTYNANRHTANGNPYKKLLTDLMAQGVQLELCGATAKANHWGNANLLPRDQGQRQCDGQTYST